jgi:hypothetical protein
MSRIFNRVITFHIEGEIFDNSTTPESIIRSYNWTFEDHQDGNIQIFGHHKDNRGRITKMTKLPKIHKWKTPDTEFFLKL